MKKCPLCRQVYSDEIIYCLNDGTALTSERFSLPSENNPGDEPVTVVRNEPIVIDFGAADSPQPVSSPGNYQTTLPPAESVVVVPANTTAATRNYALFLVLGLLIGGGLVLGTLLLSKNLFQNENANTVKTNVNYTETVKTEKLPTPLPENSNKNENVSEPIDSNKHAERTEDADGNFNGRVIVLNARVRLAPNKDAPVVETLP